MYKNISPPPPYTFFKLSESFVTKPRLGQAKLNQSLFCSVKNGGGRDKH